jgi:putative acetyltransferase
MGHPLVGIRTSAASDDERVFSIWREAVDATHHFLTPTGRQDIDAEVVAFLPQVTLWLAVDNDDTALGFMLPDDDRMEALFVHPEHRGVGIGRKLACHALSLSSAIRTDVNEQNLQAVGFDMHLGFEKVGYSPLGQQGRPYPLIHLRKLESRSLQSEAATRSSMLRSCGLIFARIIFNRNRREWCNPICSRLSNDCAREERYRHLSSRAISFCAKFLIPKEQ